MQELSSKAGHSGHGFCSRPSPWILPQALNSSRFHAFLSLSRWLVTVSALPIYSHLPPSAWYRLVRFHCGEQSSRGPPPHSISLCSCNSSNSSATVQYTLRQLDPEASALESVPSTLVMLACKRLTRIYLFRSSLHQAYVQCFLRTRGRCYLCKESQIIAVGRHCYRSLILSVKS